MMNSLKMALWTLVAAPASLMAAGKVPDGYSPSSIEPAVRWPAIMFSLVFLAAACVVGFKSSKRSHLS